jgi:hypothetical protein
MITEDRVPGAFYHVTSVGNEKKEVFRSAVTESDCSPTLNLWPSATAL